MKKYLCTALLSLLLTVGAGADTLKGTFTGIEEGDYVHLNVTAEGGEERSFFITQHDSFKPFVAEPEKFQGKKVQVEWQTVERDIPEAGGKIEIEEATSIRLLEKP